MSENNALAEINHAKQALQQANDIHKILLLRDQASAFQIFADAQGFKEAAQEAKIFQLNAERKAGDWLRDNIQNGGNPELHDVTLTDAGVTNIESHRWQQEAELPEEKFVEWVEVCQETGKEISAAGLRREVQKINIAANHAEKRSRPLPDGKFQVIYADPPWQYDNSGFDEAAESQYPTMPIEEICNLPIEDLATDTSILFMWATNPLLPEALQVLSAWGFEYKTNVAWVKDRGRGKGWFLKSKHELLLIGVRQNTPHPVERPDSAQLADRGPVHSRKPELFYELIESMYPDGSKIELFARSERPGWFSWGNEV